MSPNPILNLTSSPLSSIFISTNHSAFISFISPSI